MRISLDEFEAFITDSLYQEKLMQRVCSDQAVQAYFKLNSPKFDSIEVSHIVLDSESKAKEMLALLREDPTASRRWRRAFDRRHAGARRLIGRCCEDRFGPTSRPRYSMPPPAICWTFRIGKTDGFRGLPSECIRPAASTTTPPPKCGGCCARSGCEPGLRNTYPGRLAPDRSP